MQRYNTTKMQEQSITTKSYKKLVLKIDTQSVSYVIVDLISHEVLDIKEFTIQPYSNSNKVLEEQIKNHLQELEHSTFDQVIVLHNNSYATFVPSAFFDPENLGLYLQYNTKVYESDLIVYDTLDRYQMHNIYVPFTNINNILLDLFPTFDYKNVNTILVQKLLDYSKNKEEKIVFIHYQNLHFELVVVQNQKLILFNSFLHKTPEDFIYYLLFTMEQLQLNPESIKTYFLGDISIKHPVFTLAYTYIRFVELYNLLDLESKNKATAQQNSKYFISLHA